MKKAIVIGFMLIASTARAQFGIGETVVLAKILATDAMIYGKDVEAVQQAMQIAQTAQNAFQLEQQMAQRINTLRYGGIKTLLWQLPTLGVDRYGKGMPWVMAAQGQGSANAAYQAGTIRIPDGDWPSYYQNVAPAQRERIAVDYARLQDTDAENIAALQAISDTVRTAPEGQIATQNLVDDSFLQGFAGDPQMSQVALQQKANVGITQGLQLQWQQTQLMAHILHELVLLNRRARDEEAKKMTADAVAHQKAMEPYQPVSTEIENLRY